ncbi:hypothetical protein FXO38_36106 [Capsicum annuum]|nr:hypothetical protein FXO38_36106 [Capsicum annuum]
MNMEKTSKSSSLEDKKSVQIDTETKTVTKTVGNSYLTDMPQPTTDDIVLIDDTHREVIAKLEDFKVTLKESEVEMVRACDGVVHGDVRDWIWMDFNEVEVQRPDGVTTSVHSTKNEFEEYTAEEVPLDDSSEDEYFPVICGTNGGNEHTKISKDHELRNTGSGSTQTMKSQRKQKRRRFSEMFASMEVREEISKYENVKCTLPATDAPAAGPSEGGTEPQTTNAEVTPSKGGTKPQTENAEVMLSEGKTEPQTDNAEVKPSEGVTEPQTNNSDVMPTEGGAE